MKLLQLLCLGYIFGAVSCEREYNMELHNLDVVSDSADYIDGADLMMSQFNESTAIIGGWMNIIKAPPINAWIEAWGHEGNQDGTGYRKDPTMNFTELLCDFLVNDTMVLPELRRYGNIPDACPIELKNYTVDDFYWFGESLPDRVPNNNNNWMFTLRIHKEEYYLSEVIASVQVEVQFNPKDSDDDNNNNNNNNNNNRG